jgi:N-acetyl sugar amidotransferase
MKDVMESPEACRCTRCVMDTSVPGIEFDQDGVCNFCTAAMARLERDLFVGPGHDGKLEALVAAIKLAGRGRPYDCVIGVSGGVDSSYTAWLVKRKFGLRPLAVHLDNGWNSELAVQNIERLLKELAIDLYTHVIDWEEFRDLQLAFLKSSIANSEIPTDHAIVALLYRQAAKHGIKYIISGGNLATEVVMPETWMHDAKDLRLLKSVHRRHGALPLRTFPMMSYRRLAWYILIRRIRYIGILNYVRYDKDAAADILERELGWRRYVAKHFESIYTRFFQGYLLPRKFGMDKRLPHLSSLIVSGQMTRAQALEELRQEPYSPEMASEDLLYVRKKFGLSSEEFESIMAEPPRDAGRYPNSIWLERSLAPLIGAVKDFATGRRRLKS